MSTELTDALRKQLADYDGRAITVLGEAEASFSGEAAYLDALISLVSAEEAHIGEAATWLIKSALERGRELTDGQVRALCEQIGGLTAWQAQLHVCQSLRHLDIPSDCAAQFGDWLSPLLAHSRPFLRAWALDGLAVLAKAHPGFEERFRRALADAETDGAASVRARARAVAKGW